MMGRTQRKQWVIYVAPSRYTQAQQIVEAGQARGQRVTLSSLGDEAVQAGWDQVMARYVTPTQDAPRKRTR